MISALTPPPNALTGETFVRRFRRAYCGRMFLRTSAMTVNWSRLRFSTGLSLTKTVPRFCVTCGSSPMVTMVNWTSGMRRIWPAIDCMIVDVVCRLAPSGARAWTWNCDSSSCGRKFLFTAMPSGTMEKSAMTMAVTITQRCAIDQSSMRR